MQEEQKRNVFEATEATIYRNKRSLVKKIRTRNFCLGDVVLFKNPEDGGLATTLNIEGHIEEKVGRDLYRVGYGDNKHACLFSSQIVLQHSSIPCSNEGTLEANPAKSVAAS